ncbi:MAG TPA: hypothetical protein VHX19_18620 [Stellaceae bacterium]|jgi:hypothetical protein|nr:hypothetical protein [Stellaceae bacterium]
MAKITRTRLVVSSVALMLMAMMMPTATDAHGGGGFGGRGGGVHVGHPGTVRSTGPSIPGPATVRRSFASSPHSVASSSLSFSHRRGSFSHTSRSGSHFFTLGADGVWVDNFVYAPTLLVAQQPMVLQQSAMHRRAPAVKTPSAARAGIILVRGDSKSYVTFPSSRRG